MPILWNGSTRAVAPPDHWRESADVLEPQYSDLAASPYPLGLGVYACRTDGSLEKHPLPLFYVSDRVARDHSPTVHWHNAPGVRPGWYVIGEPGVRFELRISRVNSRVGGAPWETHVESSVHVDGVSINSWKVFGYGPLHQESVERGYVEMDVMGNSRAFRKRVRHFVFGKVDSTEGNVGANVDAGTIRLDTCVGEPVLRELAMKRRNSDRKEIAYGAKQMQTVNEKVCAKEGRSLEVRGGPLMEHTVGLSRYTSLNQRKLPEANVTVYVRQSSWMRTRRLIDDNGSPCTLEMYEALLRKDSRPHIEAPSPTHLEGPDRKRVKLQPQIAYQPQVKSQMQAEQQSHVKLESRVMPRPELVKIEPGEIIDLT